MTIATPAQGEPRSILSGWSLEATRPKTGEIEGLATLLAPGAEIYLSTLPHLSLDQQIEAAKTVRSNGFEPVLHVAARYFSTRGELAGYLARASGEVGAHRVLVIAGDIEVPRGEFGSSLALIDSGLLQAYGIRRVGIAGYPEGHPKIARQVLERALDEKLHTAIAAGLDVHVVTQFCLDARPIIDWLADFQARWPNVRIKIGLAGPCSAVTLVKFAIRCGVQTPTSGFGQKVATASRLARSVASHGIIEAVDRYRAGGADSPSVSAHFFSFGGLDKTAPWVVAARGAPLQAAATIRQTLP